MASLTETLRIVQLVVTADRRAVDDGLNGQDGIIGALGALGGLLGSAHHLAVNRLSVVDQVVAIVPATLFVRDLVVHQAVLAIVRELTSIRHPRGEIKLYVIRNFAHGIAYFRK